MYTKETLNENIDIFMSLEPPFLSTPFVIDTKIVVHAIVNIVKKALNNPYNVSLFIKLLSKNVTMDKTKIEKYDKNEYYLKISR